MIWLIVWAWYLRALFYLSRQLADVSPCSSPPSPCHCPQSAQTVAKPSPSEEDVAAAAKAAALAKKKADEAAEAAAIQAAAAKKKAEEEEAKVSKEDGSFEGLEESGRQRQGSCLLESSCEVSDRVKG